MTTHREQIALEKANQANDSLSRGYPKHAVELLTEAIRMDPLHAGYFANRSLAHFHDTRYDLAVVDADQAIKLQPDRLGGHIRKIVALLHQGNLDDAKKALAEAGKLEGSDGSASLQATAMLVHFSSGNSELALDTSKKVAALAQTPDQLNKAARILGASMAIMTGAASRFGSPVKPSPPSPNAAKVLGISGTDPAATIAAPPEELDIALVERHINDLFAEGRARFTDGDIPAAAAAWERALLLAQVMQLHAVVRSVVSKLAMAYRRMGRTDRSAALLLGCSDEAEKMRGLANTAFANGNYSRALLLFQSALEAEKRSANANGLAAAYNNIACVHVARNEPDLAAQAFRSGLEHAEKHDDPATLIASLNGLGNIAANAGEYRDALEEYYTRAFAALPKLHAALVEDELSLADTGNVTKYRLLFTQTYRYVVDLYWRAKEIAAAAEWADRTKAFSYFDAFGGMCETEGTNDVSMSELVAVVGSTSSVYLSFTFLNPAAIIGTLITPGNAEPRNEVLEWSPSLLLDIPAFLSQVERETQELTNDDAYVPWKTKESIETVEKGKVLRPSQEKLARLYDTLLQPFHEEIEDAISRGGKRLVIVPDAALFDIPWSQLIPSRDNTSKTFGADYKIVLACSAPEFVRQNTTGAKDGVTPEDLCSNVILVRDGSVAGNGEELESIAQPSMVVEGCDKGTAALDLCPGDAAPPALVHLACRCVRTQIAIGNEANVSSVLGRTIVTRKGTGGRVALQVHGDTSVQTRPSLEGWVYFHPDGSTKLDEDADVSLVKGTHAVPIDAIGTPVSGFKVPKGSVVVLDAVGRSDDLYVEAWSIPLIRGTLLAGAQAVVVVRHQTQHRMELLKVFYTALRTGKSPSDAVREATLTIRDNFPEATSADRGALAIFE